MKPFEWGDLIAYPLYTIVLGVFAFSMVGVIGICIYLILYVFVAMLAGQDVAMEMGAWAQNTLMPFIEDNGVWISRTSMLIGFIGTCWVLKKNYGDFYSGY